ncbi:gamma-glutamyltransferase [Pseudoteredinibacter isoporae]|uniref:Glutathione hydrolase proenzyme n=1 Tax=Pseudoteredinibacter isoporae TaxID=570281 RepID=A0A7X0MVS0_9GAMM|nr:gamma-glutamyltransferase [Pseudoteredinibacter isoporae]MBB6520144.1 gamma-glutamyltranspeptidase/glutathione hydrolase [Pseudoteredinibacter isoporae]NHO85716.1 gamma-glutamyltransferase [Pseudoteredinibacter isoporae]NIB25832.1 gamma-glutamyltransferase [Pseudoteredinibacter isoporae]
MKSITTPILLSCCMMAANNSFADNRNKQALAWPPKQGKNSTYILRYDSIHHSVNSHKGMVVSQNAVASQVGRDILAKGGNAVDAAVAVGFALAVTLPRAGNLGGGGFMLMYSADSGKTSAIDYRGEAPSAVISDDYIDDEGKVDRQKTRLGHTASTVPGTVSGLYAAHRAQGKLAWASLLEPAIKLADEGIEVTQDLSWALKAKAQVLTQNPESCRIFFKNCSGYLEAGDTLIQKDLAESLRLVAKHGEKAFYKGELATKIVGDMQANGGFFQAKDLANYQAHIVEPLSSAYRDHQVLTMPPPAGGLPLLQILNILENYDIRAMGAGSADNLHILAEAMKHAYADRFKYLGDPRFSEVPVKALLNKKLAKQKADSIRMNSVLDARKLEASVLQGPAPGPDTTHYSIADSEGNLVSNTYTLSASFGSGVTIAGTGILMNNQINNFVIRPSDAYKDSPREPNAIAPGKRTKSTQSPTLVFKGEKPVLVTGTPGGRRIITTVTQLISNVVDHQMNVAEATSFPRIHQGWGRRDYKLEHEPGFSPDTLKLLKDKGHSLKKGATMGSTQSIAIDGGLYQGAADSRRPGAAAVAL